MIPSPRAHLHVAALSHPGMTGKNNEDRYAVLSHVLSENHPQPSLFAVLSDGIGGHRAGEVAAELAVNHISHIVSQSNGHNPLKIMEEAIHTASQVIAQQAASNPERQGMGATCACAWIIGYNLYISYVGDSRIYLLRNQVFQQLSVDHTWVQEAVEKKIIQPEDARHHPNVHVIRRYLGSPHPPEVDVRLKLHPNERDAQARKNQGTPLYPNDVLLLCSDGLTDMVSDQEIRAILLESHLPKVAVQRLVARANQRGGYDNITVIVIAVPRQISPPTKQNSLWNGLSEE